MGSLKRRTISVLPFFGDKMAMTLNSLDAIFEFDMILNTQTTLSKLLNALLELEGEAVDAVNTLPTAEPRSTPASLVAKQSI